MPLDQRLRIYERSFGTGEDIVTIVAGLHGDELDGLYICYRLIQYLAALPPERFGGCVKLIPAANPMGLDVSSRFWPVARADINRSFPGSKTGRPTDRMADAILARARRSRYCIDIHSSNIFLQEIPQVRLSEEHFNLSRPMAGHLGVEVVWVNPSPTVIEATLAWNLSSAGVPTFVVETGIGLRIMQEDCERVITGIIGFLQTAGVVKGGATAGKAAPRLANIRNVEYINADASGVLVPQVAIGTDVLIDTLVGHIIDPITGWIKSEVRAPVSGYLFTLRAHPIVYIGSLIARIIRPDESGRIERLAAEAA